MRECFAAGITAGQQRALHSVSWNARKSLASDFSALCDLRRFGLDRRSVLRSSQSIVASSSTSSSTLRHCEIPFVNSFANGRTTKCINYSFFMCKMHHATNLWRPLFKFLFLFLFWENKIKAESVMCCIVFFIPI